MARHLPEYHSPLKAQAKRALLWVVLPAVLVAAVLYGLATQKSPDQAEQERAAQELAKKFEKVMGKR